LGSVAIAITAEHVPFQSPKEVSGIARSTDSIKQYAVITNKHNIYMEDESDLKNVLGILDKHNEDRGGLISILEEIQAEYGYLPEKLLRIVGEKTGHSLVDIYSVATFYRSFSLKPRGKHLICACLGTACHVRGAPRVVEEFERELGIKPGQTTENKEFTLETVNCLGACALGPVVVIDGHYFSKVRKSRVSQLLEQALKGFDKIETGKDKRIFPINVSCPHCNHSLNDETFSIDRNPSILVTISSDHKQGWLRLSCLYGSYNFASEFDVSTGSIVTFLCPHCGVEFPSTSDCSVCTAPMVPMLIDGGGIVQICSRRGCKNHMLDLV
jgi:NADH:ubiquinone oxidoreductase subunit E